MTYLLLMFTGGITGLILSGPAGALFGLVAGFAVSAWEELNEEVESFEDDCSSVDYDSVETERFNNDRIAPDLIFSHLTIWNDDRHLNRHHINPATGLPMIDDGVSGFDVAGNPYGMDWSSDDMDECLMSSGDLFNPSDDQFS